jgi:NTE family protein
MGQSIANYELTEADVIVRPDTGQMRSTDFDNRHQAIIEGEKAGLAAIAAIKRKVAEKTTTQTMTR